MWLTNVFVSLKLDSYCGSIWICQIIASNWRHLKCLQSVWAQATQLTRAQPKYKPLAVHYFIINTCVSFLNKYSELFGAEDGKSEWFSVTSYLTVECMEHRRSELEQKKCCWNTDNTPAFYLFVCDVSQQADRLSNASVPVSATQPHTDRESQTAATALTSPSQEAEILFIKYYVALYCSSFLKEVSTLNPQWHMFDNHSSFF